MTVFPGDEIGGFEVRRLVAYQGKEGCTSLRCTRRGVTPDSGGICVGYHCPLCDEPTNSYGHHDCKRANDVS